MYDTNIIVEVHCIRPPWGRYNPKNIFNFTDSRYRIYVNQDLITERSWIWDNDIFLIENIWIHTDKSTEYILELEPVVIIPEQAKFCLKNLKSKNLEITNKSLDDLHINFSIR